MYIYIFTCVSFGSFVLKNQHLTTCHIGIYGIIPIESSAPCVCDVSRIPSAHIGPTRKVTGNVPRIKRRRTTCAFGDVTPSSGAPQRAYICHIYRFTYIEKAQKTCEIHPLSAPTAVREVHVFFLHNQVAESLSSSHPLVTNPFHRSGWLC